MTGSPKAGRAVCFVHDCRTVRFAPEFRCEPWPIPPSATASALSPAFFRTSAWALGRGGQELDILTTSLFSGLGFLSYGEERELSYE